ncbi:MAG: exodeoxyribonuclease VII large subunit, partial [Spirochaetaceae bacterium]|nr:exodeoxyribonuclease VII large subunit [Spirochaetaceae bacterium]
MFSSEGRTIWSVSELTSAIKSQLENTFPSVSVEGEISNCHPSSAGHIYFTLKDSNAVISAALFRGRAARVEEQPRDGMQAVISGKIDVYAPRGSYQIIVDNVKAAGQGALLEAMEKRKRALEAEGLFDQKNKLPLPPYPRRVAVVTSPTGAAVRDILQVLSRRSAAPRITILPTPVQGSEAPAKIAAQIKRAGAYGLGDVLIIARGGGSLEDLMAFNEEVVVRAVAECQLPVISGVGHEIDISLTDLAADVRAATPSAAAELVSDRSEDLLLRARGFRREAAGLIRARLDTAERQLEKSGISELTHTASRRLEEAMRSSDEALGELKRAADERLGPLRRRLELAGRSLNDASPKAVMARGYARVSLKKPLRGPSITDSDQLSTEDEITLEFARG